MSEAANLHAPHAELDDPTDPKHDIALTATLNGTTITISGPGSFPIPAGQGATHCNFTLADDSGQNVQFASLDAQDNTTVCPAPGSGNNSGQIVGVQLKNQKSPKEAQFTDNNSNQNPMNVSYSWNFTCNAGYTVTPFDPIISNGGKTHTF